MPDLAELKYKSATRVSLQQSRISIESLVWRVAVEIAAAVGDEPVDKDGWNERKRNLYAEMRLGRLPYEQPNHEGKPYMLSTVLWRDLCRYSAGVAGPGWDWLRQTCMAWALANDEDYQKIISPEAIEPAPARSSGTATARTHVRNWLGDKMRVGAPKKAKAKYAAEAGELFGVGTRIFRAAWELALEDVPGAAKTWSKAGPKPKS
jgi:hypothetical protein